MATGRCWLLPLPPHQPTHTTALGDVSYKYVELSHKQTDAVWILTPSTQTELFQNSDRSFAGGSKTNQSKHHRSIWPQPAFVPSLRDLLFCLWCIEFQFGTRRKQAEALDAQTTSGEARFVHLCTLLTTADSDSYPTACPCLGCCPAPAYRTIARLFNNSLQVGGPVSQSHPAPLFGYTFTDPTVLRVVVLCHRLSNLPSGSTNQNTNPPSTPRHPTSRLSFLVDSQSLADPARASRQSAHVFQFPIFDKSLFGRPVFFPKQPWNGNLIAVFQNHEPGPFAELIHYIYRRPPATKPPFAAPTPC